MAHSTRPLSDIGLIAELRAKWGWFVALGVLFLILGVVAFANLFATTIASAVITHPLRCRWIADSLLSWAGAILNV